MRQSFLVSLLSHSPLQLSREQLDLLWSTLVEQAVTQDEQEFAFLWLTDGCSAGGGHGAAAASTFPVLSDELQSYLLSAKLLMMPASDFTLAAFRLLYRLFTLCHSRAGNIKLDEAFVLSAEQQHNDWLWEKEEEEREQMAAAQQQQQQQLQLTAGGQPPQQDETATSSLTIGSSSSGGGVERTAVSHGVEAAPAVSPLSSVLLSLPPSFTAASSSSTLSPSTALNGRHSPSPPSPSSPQSLSPAALSASSLSLVNGRVTRARSRTNSVSSVGSSSSSSSADSAASSSSLAASSSSALSVPSPASLTASGRELSVLNYGELEDVVRALWEVGLKSASQLVGHKAILVLNKLHQSVSSRGGGGRQADGKAGQVRDEHLRRCLNVLSVALQVPTERQDERTRRLISRCVFLLNSFLQSVSSSPSAPSAHQPSQQQQSQLRIAPSKELRCPPFDLPYQGKSSIGELRRLVFDHLAPFNPGLTLLAVELSWNDRKLLSSHLPLSSIPFVRGDAVVARRFADSFCLFASVPGYSCDDIAAACSQSILSAEQLAAFAHKRQAAAAAASHSPQALPSTRKRPLSDPSLQSIASDAASFERLFSLLQPGLAVSQDIWEVLMLLPTNSSHCRRFLSLDGVTVDSWSRLLDPGSVYRLVYGLQVLDDIMHARLGEDWSFDRQQRAGWCQDFIKRGGLHHLINVATSASFVQYEPARHGDRLIHYTACELLFRLVTDLFSLDPAFPIASSIAVDSGLQRGRITQHPAFDALCHKMVMEGIIPTVMQTEADALQQAAAHGQDGAGELSGAGHMLEAGMMPSSASSSSSQHQTASASALSAARSEMLHSALLLLAGCLCCRPHHLPQLLSHPSFSSLLTLLLLVSDDERTRLHAAKTVAVLARQAGKVSVACRQSMVSAVLSLLSKPVLSDFARHCSALFSLCRELVEETVAAQAQSSDAFVSELRAICGRLFSLLSSHRSVERDEQLNAVDELLVGCIRFITQIVKTGCMTALAPVNAAAAASPSAAPAASCWVDSFTQYLYSDCLFSTPDTRLGGCLCKSTVSRCVGYCALLTCVAVCPTSHSLLIRLLAADEMWHRSREQCGWRYDPLALDKETETAAVGLRNQGATCQLSREHAAAAAPPVPARLPLTD